MIELADTLAALIESVQTPRGSGLIVTEAEIDIPLEIGSAVAGGELIFFGNPPHTRWQSGVLPQVHLGHIRVELVEEE
jgi:hypothetical protein